MSTSDDTDVDIPEDAFLVKNEVAVCTKKHMTHSKGESRAARHMNIASNPESYSVPDYAGFIPTQALDARAYFDAFYSKLEKNMIHVAYSVFKYNLDLLDKDHVTEHSREVRFMGSLGGSPA